MYCLYCLRSWVEAKWKKERKRENGKIYIWMLVSTLCPISSPRFRQLFVWVHVSTNICLIALFIWAILPSLSHIRSSSPPLPHPSVCPLYPILFPPLPLPPLCSRPSAWGVEEKKIFCLLSNFISPQVIMLNFCCCIMRASYMSPFGIIMMKLIMMLIMIFQTKIA